LYYLNERFDLFLNRAQRPKFELLNNSSIDYILPDEIEALKAEKFRPKLNKQNNKNIESSITSANSGPNNNSMEVMDKESLNQLQDLVSNPDNKQIRDSGEL